MPKGRSFHNKRWTGVIAPRLLILWKNTSVRISFPGNNFYEIYYYVKILNIDAILCIICSRLFIRIIDYVAESMDKFGQRMYGKSGTTCLSGLFARIEKNIALMLLITLSWPRHVARGTLLVYRSSWLPVPSKSKSKGTEFVQSGDRHAARGKGVFFQESGTSRYCFAEADSFGIPSS